jgi:XTP/dITP diphosphohydrolase
LVPRAAQGDGGFGYDPLFFVPAAGRTFAQMGVEDKNRLSHRGDALRRVRLLLERW